MNLKLDYSFKMCKGKITRLPLAELQPAVSCFVLINLSVHHKEASLPETAGGSHPENEGHLLTLPSNQDHVLLASSGHAPQKP